MVAKKPTLRELLAQRMAESEQEVQRLNNPMEYGEHSSPGAIYRQFVTTPYKTPKQAQQEFGETIEYIRSNERKKRKAEEQASQARIIQTRKDGYVWLWDGNVPFASDLPMELRSRLEADDRLRRYATEGLYGYNWQAFTSILAEDYGLFETGRRADVIARRRTDTPEYLQWKTYVEEHPDVAAQSKKMKPRVGMSGYGRARIKGGIRRSR